MNAGLVVEPGATITAPTITGEVITGVVTDRYDTDGEGQPLSGGPMLLVRAEDGRERAVKLAAAEDAARAAAGPGRAP